MVFLKEKTDHIEVIPPHMRPEACMEHITQLVYECEKPQTSRREGLDLP